MELIEAGVLSVGVEERGDRTGLPVFLLHGFPYDVRAYDAAAEMLARRGCRVIVPYLRGYGPTRFLSPDTPRSGQQAVLAHDLIALMDALGIERAVLAGYDWGGRAACIVSALWPERVRGLVTGNGYNIQDIASSGAPATPADEHRYWYQYYFHGERGRLGLERDRHALCRLLWRLWSPDWTFSEKTFARTAVSFDNPDFVEVVVHSYRHRFALAPGDPALEATEEALAAGPSIEVPAVSIDGGSDGVMQRGGAEGDAPRFTGPYRYEVLERVGHNIPQEAPGAFAEAVLSLL